MTSSQSHYWLFDLLCQDSSIYKKITLSSGLTLLRAVLHLVRWVKGMSFWTNMFSTFIGALLGFVLSIALFYLTSRWSKKSREEELEKSLIKELEYNGYYLEERLKELKKSIERVSADDKTAFPFFDYTGYQRVFLQEYFKQGFLWKKLDLKSISRLDTILNHMNIGISMYLNKSIEDWRNGAATKQETSGVLTFERDTLEGYLEDITQVKQRITSAN